jgi:TP901 family phage tail tape measure protein
MDTKGQEQAMMNLAKHYGDSTSRINRYKKAVRDTVEMEQRRMDQIMNKIDRLRSEKKQTEAVTKEIRRLALEYDRLANEEDLSRRVKDRYEEQVKGVSRAHSRLTKELKLSGKEMGFVANQIDHVSRRIKQFGAFVAAAFVVRQVQFFFRELIRVTAEYDQALYNLRAIMEITSSQVHVLGEVIKDVARNTKFSAQEIAKGIQTLGQAGLSMQESMQAVQGIADLATGTLSSFAEVSELVTTTLNSFQLAATESARAADIFANAVNNSKLTVEKLNTVFNYVGAAGKQVGLNLNELTGSLMSLADRGIRASTMGTGLRRTMLQMIDPSRELVADLGVLGKRVEDINPKLVGWQNALKELTPLLWDARRETVDMAKVSQYFGNRAAQVAAVLIETVNSTSNSLTEAIEKTYEFGSAGRMAEIQIEGLGLKLKNLQDRAKNIVIAFGEAGLTGALKNIVDVLRDATTGFEEFINKHPWAAQIGGISTSVLFLTAVISGLIPIVFRAASVFKGLWLIHSGLFTAIGVGTAAISALIFSLNALADRHYKVMKAAGENASEHEALAEAMQSWKETFDEAFQTREWENVVKRFKNTEIAGRNLAEMIEEELQISIERLGQTDVDLSKLENAFDRTALKLHNIRIEDSLQQLRSASDELKWIYKSTGEVALEETLNTFSKTEQFVKERVLDSGLKYANPFYWFNENAEEAVDAYEEAVQSMGDSLIKLAEMSDWSTEDIIKNTAKMRARIIEEVGAESKAVQDFQQMMARTWFGEVNSEIITFQERLKKLNDLIQNDHITTVEEAKKEFGDFALEWEKFETVEDVSKAVSKEFNRLGIEQKKLFPLLQKLSYGGAEFAEVEKYIRTEMGLTVDQSKILIDHLHRLEKDITSQAIPAFNSFLNSIREISPAMAQEIEKLSDAQKAMLLSQKSTIYEAGKELREYYKGIFGGISIDDVGKIDAETLMDQLLKAGYDINNVSEVSDYINEFRENIKKQEARELSSIISDMFEEDLLKLSNNLKQYRLQYEEDSLEMLELEKKLAKERVKIRRQIYNELKNEDTRSDLLEAQQELQDAEEKIVDRKKKLIEDETKKIKKAYDKRIGMLESAAERENLIIEEKVAQGKMLEYNAQEEIAQQTVDLAEKRLAAHTEMISKMSKSSDDYNDALIENKELVNELKEAEINRFEATLSKYEGIFSREKELIELRKQASLAGLQEDTYYRIIENQSGKVIAEFDKQERATYETYKTRLAVEKQSSSEILRLYDQRLQKILALKGKNNDEYRKLLMERTIFEKEQLANIVELERKTAEQRIIAHGTAMEQIKLGLRQYKEEYKTEGEFWVDSSKNFAENMHNSFRDDFFKPFITGTESASDAFHNFTQSILNNMLNILADSITRDFMNVIGLAASGGSTSGGGSSGGDSSSQMAGWASTLFSAVVSYFHKGGVVGKDGEKRFAPASLFKDAPRLHTGLRPNEFPAILEKGETVIPADKSKRDFANTGQSQVNYFNVTVQAPDGNISKESQRQLQRRLTRSVAMANRRA